MAGEIGHVVYGAEVAHYLGVPHEEPTFWLGTLFPDIGHLGVTSRHRTHATDVSLRSLLGETPFVTGMRVHAWIDATREQYLHDQHIKEALPWHPFVPHALKLYEDDILYSSFTDWNLIQRVLATTTDLEHTYVSDDAAIHRWHNILQDYFHHQPSDASRFELARAIGLSESSARELNTVVQRLAQHTSTRELLANFQQHLHQLLT